MTMTYQPKHRAERVHPSTFDPFAPADEFDAPSSAKCTVPNAAEFCPSAYCPRHEPGNYAAAMAVHANDSVWATAQ